MESLDR